MDVYISINGPLRNLIQKFDYHYRDEFINSDFVVEIDKKEEPFDYKVTEPIHNDNLLNYYSFQSIEEYNNFLFVDFPLEIFGHSGISHMSAMSDLNKMIYENPEITFTVIGLDEFSKAKSSTLFFLSKHSYLGNNVKFIRTSDIKKEWKKCDLWITDSKVIIDMCPRNKKAVKFETEYNEFFTHKHVINKLTTCSKFWEKTTTSMWTRLFKNVVPSTRRKNAQKMVTTLMMMEKNKTN